MGISSDQSISAYRERADIVCGFESDDWGDVAKCFRGGGFCGASAERGIGGMDCGEEKCFKHDVLAADNCKLLEIYEREECGMVFINAVFMCDGIDEQADGGDIAVYIITAGLLAAGEVEEFEGL